LADLAARVMAGDPRAMARAISLVEDESPDAADLVRAIFRKTGRAYLVGVTGPPGAGKSTLVDRMVATLRSGAQPPEVGVIAVDPTSPFSGGAVLGDRIRMQSHFLDPQVFIRSLSTRGRRGGLARATRQVARLLDAFGKNHVIIETVGVGQSELDIMEVAQTVVVALVPEAGDTVQVMKAGLLEIAHIFVVNKADREGAVRMKTELEMMLQLRPAPWSVPVLLTEASRDRGIDELMAAIAAHRRHRATDGAAKRTAEEHRQREFFAVLGDALTERVEGRLERSYADLLGRVRRGDQDPYSAALEVLRDREGLRRLIDGLD
jgi:LAO/AO transport system kinase